MQRFLCIVLVLIIGCLQPSFANSDKKSNDNSVAEVVEDFYEAWNEHDLEKLFTYYSRNFITGDGITREDYKNLLKCFGIAILISRLKIRKKLFVVKISMQQFLELIFLKQALKKLIKTLS